MTDEAQVRTAFDDATDAEMPAQEYWGQMNVDAWSCALVTGQGKVPFDPAQHDKKFTAIDISMTPLGEMNLKWAPERDMIAQFKEWIKTTWYSAKKLGIAHASHLDGKYVRAKLVKTGEYEKKKDGIKTGEKGDETNFEFIAFFDTEEECRADYFATTGKSADDIVTTEQPIAKPNNENAEKERAKSMLKGAIKRAFETDNEPLKNIEMKIAMPMISKFFSFDDEEVQEMIMSEGLK